MIAQVYIIFASFMDGQLGCRISRKPVSVWRAVFVKRAPSLQYISRRFSERRARSLYFTFADNLVLAVCFSFVRVLVLPITFVSLQFFVFAILKC